MAVDTRNKRSSAIGVSLPWRMRFPAPDGSFDAADRLHINVHYAGIGASSPVSVPYLDLILELDSQVDRVLFVDGLEAMLLEVDGTHDVSLGILS